MDSRFVIIPFILIVLAVIELDNRNYLHRKLTDEELKGYHSPFIPLIVCAAIFFVFLFLVPNKTDEYNELKEKYDDLVYSAEISYDDASLIKYILLNPDGDQDDVLLASAQDIIDRLDPNSLKGD